MRRGATALAGLLTAAALAAAPAGAARIETIQTPSRHVNPATAIFAGGKHIDALRANVLLPDGYDDDPTRLYPVLFLIHATGGDYRHWLEPEGGNVKQVARGFDAIVVMPEAGLGFLTNWWNEGKRGDPAWERFYLDELVPLIERRYRIRQGRRWRAIAGWSMGGMGAVFLSALRPGYFGTALSISGFVSIQRPYLQQLWGPAAGVDYEDLWGPSAGFYATGHNPAALTDNLQHSHLIVTAGDGKPRPGVPFGPGGAGAAPFQGLLEGEVRMESDDLVAGARASKADVAYLAHDGIHDWPYAREDLAAAMKLGLFRPVADEPARWTYHTVAGDGEVWGLRYSFARSPEQVVTLRRDGATLAGEGTGTVTVTTPGGCELTAGLPFKRPLPAGSCTDHRIHLTVAPARVHPGRTARLRFRATTIVRGRPTPVAGARLRVLRRSASTGRTGRAGLRVTVPRGLTRIRVTATKRGLRSAAVTVPVS